MNYGMKKFLTNFVLGLCLLSSICYAAEFGDHCTYSLSEGRLFKTQCLISTVYEGKTYCFGTESGKDEFLDHPHEMLAKAKAFYEKQAMLMPAANQKDSEGRTKISQADAMAQIKSNNCDLSNRDAGYLEFDGMDLRHCKMVNTSFFGAYLRGATLEGANLEGAYLNLARLEGANLSHTNLENATIFQAIFDKTNFKGANLTNARMIGTLGNVDMSDAIIVKGRYGLDIGNQPMGAMRFDAVGGNFSNSNFEGADINRCNLQFANLRNANLRNTDLFRADLSQADLTGADITGANLNESTLDGTIMTDVKGIEFIKGYKVEKGHCVACGQ
jgi:uncharacterized protein YjbI with pentapeptide repeats/YHS domain-containing protein